METTQEKLKQEESIEIESLLDEMYKILKDPKQDAVNVKELKAYMYYSQLHEKHPLAYKVISDLEQDATTKLSLAEFRKVFLGTGFNEPAPPSIQQLCMVQKMRYEIDF